jgi:hypothetical protein
MDHLPIDTVGYDPLLQCLSVVVRPVLSRAPFSLWLAHQYEME